MKTKIYEELAHLYPLWRETCLGRSGCDLEETNFITSVFKDTALPIRSIIDLGGGVGTHSKFLVEQGYDVTLFDQSKKALSLAKTNCPNLRVENGSFETINLTDTFDAAICMWSTLSYVLDEVGRDHFYGWMKKHVRHCIILDEANFYAYPDSFHKIYEGENDDYTLTITRDWTLDNNHLKKTIFNYDLFNKHTKTTEKIDDAEAEQYVTVEKLEEYLGDSWKLSYLLGGYDIKKLFDKNESSRIITVFLAKNS